MAEALTLKPCPFCGGEASLESIDNARWSVGCNSPDESECMGYQSLTTFARQSDAIAAWNRRSEPEARRLLGEVEKALEPFARMSEAVDALALEPSPRNLNLWAADFRRARSALDKRRKGMGDG